MPHGKAIQGPDWHHDGQNFSKAYGIKFLNKDGKEEYAYQNTWAISTRMLGIMFAVHSDTKGLILPPKVASNKVVIVPILFEDSKDKVLKVVREIEKDLNDYDVLVDDREEYKPGYKFNEWELKGIPIRIEIGPKDLDKKEVVLVRRDNGEKESVIIKDLKNKIGKLLEEIQEDMFKKAYKMLHENIVECKSIAEVKKALESKKIAFAPILDNDKVEEELKTVTSGAKVLNVPDKQANKKGKCIISGKEASYWAYIGKSY